MGDRIDDSTASGEADSRSLVHERRGSTRAARTSSILSEYVWRTRFNAARDVIGKKLNVNSVPREIVGVMPERFSFPAADTRLWLPARVDPNSHDGWRLQLLGCRAPRPGRDTGGRTARARDGVAKSGRVVPAARVWNRDRGVARSGETQSPSCVSLRDEITNGIAHTLWMFAVAAGLVLLVAWANVSNLMLIRADGRATRARGPRSARRKPSAHPDALPRRIARAHHDGRSGRASRGVGSG